MAWQNNQQIQSFVYYDFVNRATGGNPIAPYQLVSLATAAEVDQAVADGVANAQYGNVVVPCVVSAGVSSRRIAGVTVQGGVSGKELGVAIAGIAQVMVNAAVALDSLLHAAAVSTRTGNQTPFTNLPIAKLPADPRLNFTYNLVLADDTAITPQSGSANVRYNPLGYAMDVATAQYDVIPVMLATTPIYA